MIVPARDNPFRVERVLTVRYEPLDTTWRDLLSRLEALRYRAAIVGPHGSGKTTLLEDIGDRLRSSGHTVRLVRLCDRRRRLPADALAGLSASEVVMIDGADLLPWWVWRRACWATRGAGGLIVTCHWRPMLPTLIETRTTPELLRRIAARLADGPAALDERTAADLHARHAGNIRHALRHLYDCYSRGGRLDAAAADFQLDPT